jgi:hypothetical protein
MTKVKNFKNLTQQDINVILKTNGGAKRLLTLLENHVIETRLQAENVWKQIVDREEAAARWMNILIILGLLQLFPITDPNDSKAFLLVTLPSFAASVYLVAFTLWKHPNYIRSDFFTPEEADIQNRLDVASAENKHLEKFYSSLVNRYNKKGITAGYIGIAILVNFTLSLGMLIGYKIFDLNLNDKCLPTLIGLGSLVAIYIIKNLIPNESFSQTYTQDENRNKSFTEK